MEHLRGANIVNTTHSWSRSGEKDSDGTMQYCCNTERNPEVPVRFVGNLYDLQSTEYLDHYQHEVDDAQRKYE